MSPLAQTLNEYKGTIADLALGLNISVAQAFKVATSPVPESHLTKNQVESVMDICTEKKKPGNSPYTRKVIQAAIVEYLKEAGEGTVRTILNHLEENNVNGLLTHDAIRRDMLRFKDRGMVYKSHMSKSNSIRGRDEVVWKLTGGN